MVLGGILGMAGFALPAVEIGITPSVICLGLRLPLASSFSGRSRDGSRRTVCRLPRLRSWR
ncbi:HupE/UreJ family protein [Kaistia soli]|uniref:HupE/UreJ family protein n=1 Tax=Kaistia soli TaxID=446684 RepID=UPI001114F518